MAITEIVQVGPTSQVSFADAGVAEYRARLKAKSTVVLTDPDEILQHKATPEYNRSYYDWAVNANNAAPPADTSKLGVWAKYAWLQTKVPVRDDRNPYLWWVDCVWSTKSDIPGIQSAIPENRSVLISVGTEVGTEALIFDLDGNPIVNSANVPFIPPITTEYPILVFNFKRFMRGSTDNENTYFSEAHLAKYKGAINSFTWNTFTKNKAFISKITGELVGSRIPVPDVNNKFYAYYLVNYEIKVHVSKYYDYGAAGTIQDPKEKDRTWIYRALNQGLQQWSTALGKPVPIPNGHGGEITTPVLLDEDGLPINTSVAGYETQINYQSFRRFKYADFNDLALPKLTDNIPNVDPILP